MVSPMQTLATDYCLTFGVAELLLTGTLNTMTLVLVSLEISRNLNGMLGETYQLADNSGAA